MVQVSGCLLHSFYLLFVLPQKVTKKARLREVLGNTSFGHPHALQLAFGSNSNAYQSLASDALSQHSLSPNLPMPDLLIHCRLSPAACRLLPI